MSFSHPFPLLTVVNPNLKLHIDPSTIISPQRSPVRRPQITHEEELPIRITIICLEIGIQQPISIRPTTIISATHFAAEVLRLQIRASRILAADDNARKSDLFDGLPDAVAACVGAVAPDVAECCTAVGDGDVAGLRVHPVVGAFAEGGHGSNGCKRYRGGGRGGGEDGGGGEDDGGT